MLPVFILVFIQDLTKIQPQHWYNRSIPISGWPVAAFTRLSAASTHLR